VPDKPYAPDHPDKVKNPDKSVSPATKDGDAVFHTTDAAKQTAYIPAAAVAGKHASVSAKQYPRSDPAEADIASACG